MQSVQSTLNRFLTAFSQLQLDDMLACFADDATAFFPAEHQRLRLTGKAAIGAAFAQVLARVRGTGAMQLRLDAEGVQIQAFGDVAVITFHILGDHLSRRTFVVRRTDDQWLIVHFHGSNVPSHA